MDSITQSLAGRTAIVKLLPLAFNELQDYNKALDLNSIIYRGSYPEIVSKNLNPSEAMGFYVQTYLERDVRQIQAIRDLSVFQNFIKLLAGRSGQLLNMSSLSSDLGISEGTIKNWISVAEASFLIYKVPPYYKKLGKRITKTPKIYFYDTSLLCYLLGIRNAEQLATHPARGSIFETYIVSECIKYLWNLGLESNLYFYLDKVLEIDLIAETTKGPIAIEIKSSATFKENLLSRLKQSEPRLKELLSEKFLVLGNEESFSFKNFRIISYRSLGELGELIVS
jgi:predicted AAA+ superfamily ATPase